MLVVIPIVGEYVDPECLARAAKCSRSARSLIAPILERMMGEKGTVSRLLPRLFPGITGFPVDQETPFYRALLDAFYTADPNAPMKVEVSYAIGHALSGRHLDAMEMTHCVMRSMRTAGGRQMIVLAIQDWRVVVERRPMNFSNGIQLHMLDTLARGVRSDFAVLSGLVTSRYDLAEGNMEFE